MDRLPPVGKAARVAVAGATAVKVGAKKLALLSKRPFLSTGSFQRQRSESDDEVAEALFQGLSTLRGSALKVAQMMSLELGLLPDAYRKELYKSHYRAPPLNRAVVRRLLLSELGGAPEEVFDEFEMTAFAAASLGQVHKARSRDGRLLAVKIQYPGIGTALKNDLQLVRQFVLPFVRSEYLVHVVREVEHRLSEEIDYGRERLATAWFHEHAQDLGVVVPRVFEAYSTAAVLSTEFVDGLHLDQWLETRPSQERRDHVAQTIYDCFVRSFAKHRRIHSDPNPGNYLFCRDGTVAVVDFGSVKAFDPELGERMLQVWRAIIQGDVEQIITHYCALGIGRGDRCRVEKVYPSALAPLDSWMAFPYREDVFDFGKYPDYCAQGTALYREIVRHDAMSGFTVEGLLFDRNIYGLYRLFTELGARVRMKNQWVF